MNTDGAGFGSGWTCPAEELALEVDGFEDTGVIEQHLGPAEESTPSRSVA